MKRMKGIIYIGGEKRQHLNGQGKESSDKQRAAALVRHSQQGDAVHVFHMPELRWQQWESRSLTQAEHVCL